MSALPLCWGASSSSFARSTPLTPLMPTLNDKDAGRLIGRVSDDDLQFLIDQLEETSDSDTDYWIDENTILLLEEEGGSDQLIGLLRAALSGRDGFDVQWSRD
jgi:hypothetical protein